MLQGHHQGVQKYEQHPKFINKFVFIKILEGSVCYCMMFLFWQDDDDGKVFLKQFVIRVSYLVCTVP